MAMIWHHDRSDVPDGDGPLIARDMSARREKMYARARDVEQVRQLIKHTPEPALYEHAGDAPCTLYFVVKRTTDHDPDTVIHKNLEWIVRFLARAGETVDLLSLRVLDGSPRRRLDGSPPMKALFHVLVPSLYLADEDARLELSRALRARIGREPSDVDPESYGKCAMLLTIGSSEYGAKCPLRARCPDAEYWASNRDVRRRDAEYFINPVRAGAKPLRFGTSVAALALPVPAALHAQCASPTSEAVVATTTVAVADAQVVVATTAWADPDDSDGTPKSSLIGETEEELDYWLNEDPEDMDIWADTIENLGAQALVVMPAAVMQREAVATPASAVGTGRVSVAAVDMPTTLSICGQTVVLLGKMQESIDRLIESPGGVWDTIENLGDIARALQHAKTALDPLMTLRGFVAETPEEKLRAWVEGSYTHVPLHEKDAGTKLEVLFEAYTHAVPPVHTPLLGKIRFASMLLSIYANVGPHRNTARTGGGIYLLR
jgi:hypothetical protein